MRRVIDTTDTYRRIDKQEVLDNTKAQTNINNCPGGTYMVLKRQTGIETWDLVYIDYKYNQTYPIFMVTDLKTKVYAFLKFS